MTPVEREQVDGVVQALRDATSVWERIAIQNDPAYGSFAIRAVASTEYDIDRPARPGLLRERVGFFAPGTLVRWEPTDGYLEIRVEMPDGAIVLLHEDDVVVGGRS